MDESNTISLCKWLVLRKMRTRRAVLLFAVSKIDSELRSEFLHNTGSYLQKVYIFDRQLNLSYIFADIAFYCQSITFLHISNTSLSESLRSVMLFCSKLQVLALANCKDKQRSILLVCLVPIYVHCIYAL